MLKDYFLIAINSIKNRKLRAILTVLGVIISITAIITLILLGNGLKSSINEQFEQMGSQLITVMPKGTLSGGGNIPTSGLLSQEDIDNLESLPYFDYVTPMTIKMAERIEYRNTAEYVMLSGIPLEDFGERFGDWDWELLEGDLLSEKDNHGAVVGYLIWKDIFDKRLNVKNKVIIKDTEFEVVGILDKIGNQQDDNNIIIGLEAFRELYDNPDQVDTILLQVKDAFDPELIADKTYDFLERRRNDEHFEIYTAKQIMDQFNQILGGVTFLLSAIAFISLIVGGIGIMNSMFTNVLERTSEIGIMKSIGAKNKDIMKIFLIEAGIIGLIGGIIGATIGQSLAFYIANLINESNFLPLTIQINFPVIALMILFAVGISVLSGYLPAKRASMLKPVDAIRYD